MPPDAARFVTNSSIIRFCRREYLFSGFITRVDGHLEAEMTAINLVCRLFDWQFPLQLAVEKNNVYIII